MWVGHSGSLAEQDCKKNSDLQNVDDLPTSVLIPGVRIDSRKWQYFVYSEYIFLFCYTTIFLKACLVICSVRQVSRLCGMFPRMVILSTNDILLLVEYKSFHSEFLLSLFHIIK